MAKTNWACIAGDDGFLVYYHECGACGTIVLDDHRKTYDLSEYECPVCNPNQEEFPFEYVPEDRIDAYGVPGPFGPIPLRERLKAGFL